MTPVKLRQTTPVIRHIAAFCTVFCMTLSPVLGQKKISYSRQEYMIAMRDGIKLYTLVYAPDSLQDQFPILISRGPYGSAHIGKPTGVLAEDGYIWVYQDIRGKHKSEGQYVMNRPVLDKPGNIDESTDTYDTIEWLIHNIKNNNGKAGILGSSYYGWTTLAGSARPHPALKAANPQAAMGDLFLGDDFHHNGAFRLSYALDYTFGEEGSRTDTSFQYDEYDVYTWFLKLGPLSNVNKRYFHNRIPTWNLFMQHPNYDSFWRVRSPLSYMDYPRVATLHTGGVWDPEDLNGPQLMYTEMEKRDSNNKNFICLGPWIHGAWNWDSIWRLDRYVMGSNTSGYFQRNIQKVFFDYWLKGIGDGKFPEATVFQTGSNVWKTYNTWPPKEAVINKIYPAAGGKMSFEKPSVPGKQAYDEYVSDPKKPVPYRPRPIEQTYGPGSRWYLWMLGDQRFVDGRPDVVSWQTDTLTQDMTVTGEIIAHVFASTTGSDADFVVKLIDVYPGHVKDDIKLGGYQFMIASEIFRGRFRKSFSKPEAFTPGKVEEIKIGLHQVDHVFKKGHRIMVQVQSSWFPLIDMNPQKFVPNIYDAKASDYQKATIRIHRSAEFATYLELPQVTK
ncbi:CocE/NonD family hydrolase [Agriterribacter humi]|uniref:CocE/NonD family hydrolase n=1 Tax=Agriterribacter humi TaxID=1104781 RepID=UPI00186AFB3C|nr:CocE/NonD family hydrolase [Agriterribacter humi]